MTTASIFVELLIAGSFSIGWILLFSLKLSVLDTSMFQALLSLNDSNSAWLVGLGFAVAYQVGVLMNLMAYWILYSLREKSWRRCAVLRSGANSFEQMRIVVFQKGSEPLVQGLLSSLHFARMGRTGIFNFLLLTIALLLYDRLQGMAAISFILALGSVPVWIMQGKRYYRRVGVAYQELSRIEPQASSVGRGG